MQNDQEKKSGLARLGYIWNDWISTFIILALLLMTLLIGTGEMIHGQMLPVFLFLFWYQLKMLLHQVLASAVLKE
jgi:hypothetical protein